ncbi:SA1362 family protein [Virgibacillus halophilus]|uniref:SA1362 family protein n=1 Tax=Tigheibacillus halophilus TaxID=361280 RepID=UPI00363E5236
MLRNVFSKLVYIIIGLAVIGIIAQLVTNTSGFLKSIFIMVGVAAVATIAFYFLFGRTRRSGNEMKKYRKAVKQSTRKYKKHAPSTSKKASPGKLKQTQIKKRIRKGPSHLRVIDGNKSKRNNKRASN